MSNTDELKSVILSRQARGCKITKRERKILEGKGVTGYPSADGTNRAQRRAAMKSKNVDLGKEVMKAKKIAKRRAKNKRALQARKVQRGIA